LSVLGDDSRWNELAGVSGWRPVYLDSKGVVQLSGLDAGGSWSRTAFGVVSDGLEIVVYDSDTHLQGSSPVGEIDGDLVLSTMDGVFRVGPDGSARRNGSGQPLALSDTTMVVLSCDDAMRCGPSAVDVVSGETRPLPDLPGALVAASLSPDGSHIVVATEGASSSGVVVFALVGDSWVPAAIEGGWPLGSAVWSDRGAMWWDPDGRQLVSLTFENDRVRTQVLPLDVVVQSAVVVPRAELPQAWQNALDAG
jgi:hypothetical protein